MSARPHAERCTFVLVMIALAGCAPLSIQGERAARSSLGCMKAAVAEAEIGGLVDKQQHCIAAGLIAQRCSATEALLASVGKEIQDLFGPGDAQLSDIGASRVGIRCAKGSKDPDELRRCCHAEM